MLAQPIYVYEGRFKILSLALALYFLAAFQVYLVIYSGLTLLGIPGVPYSGPLFPISFCVVMGTILFYRAVVRSFQVAFYEDFLTATNLLGKSLQIPYSQLEYSPPLLNKKTGQYSKFMIRPTGTKSTSPRNWIVVGNPRLKQLNNNYLFDWLVRRSVNEPQ